ncbi:MAG: Gfo/Idh/MocA family oxidoreductase [Oscillospiraceae bacterium]|nr:Gfo/Idh/MocA family oxidoreductase [Oscillospiraceae bacterium]
MAKVLTYGMVGGGPGSFIGDAHRRAIALDGKAKIVAGVFSSSQEKSLQTAAELHIDKTRCYRDYLEMAEKEGARADGIDFVVVVTPNFTHYDICKAFLNAGINVACDKPVTTSYAQAKELQNLAEEKGLLFLVTYTYMGHVTAKCAQELIRRGDIGEVRTVMAEYPQGWLAFEDDIGGKQGEWRCDPNRSGGVNCLGDLGTHVENAVATMTGLKIKRVLARMDVVVPGRVLDDNDAVLVEYETGATGIYWSSQVAIGSDNSLRVRIYGSKGTILWFQEESEKLTVIDTDGTIRTIHRGYGDVPESAAKYGRLPAGHTEGWLEAMGNLYRSFIGCILAHEGGTFTEALIDYPTIEAGVEGLAFVEACLESSQAGNVWVNVQH